MRTALVLALLVAGAVGPIAVSHAEGGFDLRAPAVRPALFDCATQYVRYSLGHYASFRLRITIVIEVTGKARAVVSLVGLQRARVVRPGSCFDALAQRIAADHPELVPFRQRVTLVGPSGGWRVLR